MHAVPHRARKILALLLCAALAVMAAAMIVRRLPTTEDTAALGRVRIYPAWLAERGFVFLFSGAAGWDAEDAAAARTLARRGQRVIGIDAPTLLAKAGHKDAGCLYLPGVLEGYSEAAQRRDGSGLYREPVIVGRGAGATLVYQALVQAPVLAFSGGVMLDAVPELDFNGEFCDQTAAQRASDRYTVSVAKIAAGIPALFLANGAGSAESAAFMNAISAGHLASGDAAHGDGESLGARYAAACVELAARVSPRPLADLPLVELPAAANSNGPFAILYSGDGGWRDLDRSLADVLAGRGMPVVGVDLLHYYWKPRSPAQAGSDLARIITYYQGAWRRRQVVLIGFSLGANVLPFLVNRLPPAQRAAVRLISLLSAERATAFEVDPKNWLGLPTRGGMTPIGPELQRLPRSLVQCVYGEAEAAESLCTTPAARGTRVLRKSGDHHFDYDYERLADDILSAAKAGS